MIDVATLSVIRRWALREQLSIREIARRTGLSRNTIRKYLRAMATLLESNLPVSAVMQAIDGPLVITRTNLAPTHPGDPK